MLQWQEIYATGTADIDDQHRKLFGVINELHDAIAQGKGEMYLDKALKFLAHYAKVHFNFEEICMAKYQCPVALKNKEAHRDFLEKYKKYQERFEKEGYSEHLLYEIHKMCEDWLTHHVCAVDTHLRSCVPKAQQQP